MFIENEELFFLDYEGGESQSILYAPRRSYLALVKNDLRDAVLNPQNSNAKHELLQRLRSRKYIDLEEFLSLVSNVRPILSVAVTENCSLRCTYCYASAGEPHKRNSMTTEMINSLLISYFNYFPELINPAQFKTKNVEIRIMGGGEATYEFDKLKYLVERSRELAAERELTCSFSLPTNGIYGNTIREFLAKNMSSISLSFDGIPEIQNLHRPLPNGSPSFPIVYETAKYFYEHQVPFAFRSTVSDYSLNYLEEITSFFHKEFPGILMSLEPLSPLGRANYNQTVRPPDKKLFGEKLVALMKSGAEKGMKIVNSASSEFNMLRPVFCSNVAVPNWTVAVDGRIYCCERDDAPDDFLLGQFDFDSGEFVLFPEKIQKIRQMNVFSYPECADCFCKYHCAGDCPDRRLAEHRSCEEIRSVGKYVLSNHFRQKDIQAYQVSAYIQRKEGAREYGTTTHAN